MVGPLQICYVLCIVWQAVKWPRNIYLTLENFQTFSELLVRNKKKKKGGGQGEEGEGVLSNTASRRPRFQFSLSLTPYTGKSVEAAVQCCLPFGCHSAMTSTWISSGVDENQTANPLSGLNSDEDGSRLPGTLRH